MIATTTFLFLDDSKFFAISNDGPVVVISYNELSLEGVGVSFFSFSIIAELSGIRGHTTIIISLQETDGIIAPKFEKAIYEGNLNERLELTFEDILLDPTTYTEFISFKYSGRDFELFSFVPEQNRITVSLKNPLSNVT